MTLLEYARKQKAESWQVSSLDQLWRELAEELSVHPSLVKIWAYKIKPIAAHHVLRLEKLTQGAVSRHDLRPDLYPIED
jgi:DNA-binding transcriptional regulator YdaS (Cro superfamily)